ncbi:MAG: PAS sensor histidine kinase [uncultured archaeon A07HB70]|nr:MAG: PAS sensor histidine kinase [uncultured archaeon A07HB70]
MNSRDQDQVRVGAQVRVAAVDAPTAAERVGDADVDVRVVETEFDALARTRSDCVVLGDPTPERIRAVRRAAPGAGVVAVTADDPGPAVEAGARDVLDPTVVDDCPTLAARRVADAGRAAAADAFRRTVDATTDATAVVGTNGLLEAVDEEFAALAGAAPAELVGQPAATVLDGRHVDLMLGTAEGAAPHPEPDTVVAFEHEDDDGRRLETRVAPVVADGSLAAVAVALRDVTGRELMNAELGRRGQRLEEVASLVSHDLRNPLNVVTGRLSLALETEDVSHVEPALRATERLSDLVDDIQALARASQQVTPGETETVALAFTARVAWGRINSGDATLDAGPASGETVEADEERLLALLSHLFENAVAHAGPAPTVRVEPTTDGFAVVDDGPGFGDAAARAVEPGFTTDDDRTGFGLATVVAIADAHGWRTRVGDAVDGAGARVTIHTDDTPTRP